MPPAIRNGHVLPAQLIELSEVDGRPISWMQTARVGKFVSSRYGRFAITGQDIEDAERNIKELKGQIPVDYDHLMMHVSKPGDGIAAGWFQDAERRNNDKELWGLIEWTPKAAEHIRNKEYRFCSPVVVPNHVDNETEEKKGTHIMCAAITNVPFIKGMAPLQLSDQGELQLAEVSMPERQQRISAAFYDKFAKNSMDSVDAPWIVDYFDDYLIARKGGKLLKLAFTVDESLNVSFPSDPVEVVVNYAELSEIPMPEEKKPTTTPEPQVMEMREQLNLLDGTVKTLSARLEASENEAKSERDKRIALEQQLRKKESDTLVLSLIQAGKLAKKQEDWAKTYALNDPEGFEKFAQTLDPIVKLRTEHGSGEDDEHQDRPEDPVKRMMALCNDYIDKNGGKDKVKYGEAMRAVGLANPELALAYREAFITSGTPGVN